MNKTPMKNVYLTRRSTFCAAHRLHAEELSDEENLRIFDKCNNPNGHGHNYVMYVTIKGDVDPVTGIIMNLVELKDIIEEHIIDKVDHKHLNFDVDFMKDKMPSLEVLAVVFWDILKPHLPNLYEVKLTESENNEAFYRG